jgi:DNA-binding transcriptional MerR regulator
MFKIGDFSKLSQVSVKALRYYDEMGLLKPMQVDRFTGYRYYAAEQLLQLNLILTLKDLGLSLEQIAGLLEEGLPPAQLQGMLHMKRAEIRGRVQEEEERLKRVEARLRQIEGEGKMSAYNVLIKRVEPLRAACLRDTVPTYGDQGPLWGELEACLARQGVRPAAPCLTVYYDTEYRERDVDLEVCEPIDGRLAGEGRVAVRELPGVEMMATVVHHSSYRTLHEAYQAMMAWIGVNGYRIAGPNRELYLHGGGEQDNPDCVTEVQIPVVA